MQQSFWMPHLRICLRQMRPDVPLRSLVTTRYNFWNSCHLLARFLPAPVFHQALILPPQWQPRESKPVSFFPFGFSVLFGFTLSSKQVQDQQNICRRFFRAETNIDGKQQSFGSPVLMLFSSKTFHKTMRLHSATEAHSLKLNPKNDLSEVHESLSKHRMSHHMVLSLDTLSPLVLKHPWVQIHIRDDMWSFGIIHFQTKQMERDPTLWNGMLGMKFGMKPAEGNCVNESQALGRFWSQWCSWWRLCAQLMWMAVMNSQTKDPSHQTRKSKLRKN